MKTVLTHFYNEEYLLPWWLEHHKKYFDHGILVDQRSTDNSVEIIKQICPTWQIVRSKNDLFDCDGTDREMQELEANLTGWRTSLTVTEFLCGDYGLLDRTDKDQFLVKVFVMIDQPDQINNCPTYDQSLIEQKSFGYWDHGYRHARSIHTKEVLYRHGRHWIDVTTDDLAIFWYGWCPWNECTKARKLQIQHRIPKHDVDRGFGHQHHVTSEQLEEAYHARLRVPAQDMKIVFPLAYK